MASIRATTDIRGPFNRRSSGVAWAVLESEADLPPCFSDTAAVTLRGCLWLNHYSRCDVEGRAERSDTAGNSHDAFISKSQCPRDGAPCATGWPATILGAMARGGVACNISLGSLCVREASWGRQRTISSSGRKRQYIFRTQRRW